MLIKFTNKNISLSILFLFQIYELLDRKFERIELPASASIIPNEILIWS